MVEGPKKRVEEELLLSATWAKAVGKQLTVESREGMGYGH